MKKRSTAALAFDEASSGSDGSLSSDDDDEGSVASVPDKEHSMLPSAKRNSSDSDDSDSDDSDSDSDSDGESDGEQVEEEHNPNNGEEESYDGASDSDEEGEEEDLPLQERIQKKEERGLSLRTVRERKSRALEVASERLKKLKRAKPEEKEDNTTTQSAKKKKKSKHAPTEVSSTRADYFKRGAPKLNESGIGIEIGAHKYKPLDPRQSNLSGHLNEEQFETNYAFLDEIRSKEMTQLKKQIAARKVTGKKGKKMRRRFDVDVAGGSLEEDQENLKRLQQEKAEMQRRKLDRAAKQTVKRTIRDDVAEGKRGAYHLKRKDQRRLELEAKLEVIRKRGGDKAVEKAVAKRRKKNKSRDAGLFVK